jgi:hypothetical protein
MKLFSRKLNRFFNFSLLFLIIKVSVSAQPCLGALSVKFEGNNTGIPMSVTINSTQQTLDCYQNAVLTTEVVGGNSGFTPVYDWGDNSSNSNLVVTTAGTYVVTVTSANGCTSTSSYTLDLDCSVYNIGVGQGCQSIGTLDDVKGNKWFHFVKNGKIIASIYPNGHDLGSVELDLDLWEDPTLWYGSYFLPRYFHFKPEFNGPWEILPVLVRLYFFDAELDETNVLDPSPDVLRSELSVTHYNNINDDCILTNDAFSRMEVHKPNVVDDSIFVTTQFWLEVGVKHFSEFGAKMYNSGIALPLELISFKGRAQKEDNLLEWTTSNEMNTNHFEIERSIDNVNFVKVGQKLADGNSNTIKNYSFLDKDAPSFAYYRLRAMDNDATFLYSNIIYLEHNRGNLSGVNVYPNPTSDQLFVEFFIEKESNVTFKVTDIAGKLLRTQQVMLNKGMQRQIIDMTQFPQGAYLLFLENEGNNSAVRKIIKD